MPLPSAVQYSIMDKHVIITIGRQFGSGGKSIATAIGERLGIPVYDQELILNAARKSGLSPEFIKGSDESRSLSRLGGILGLFRFWNNAGNPVGDNELFRIQSETIRELAQQGARFSWGGPPTMYCVTWIHLMFSFTHPWMSAKKGWRNVCA